MIEKLQTTNFTNAYVTFKEPKICPICKHAIEPNIISNRFHGDIEKANPKFSIFSECPACNDSFISTYTLKFISRSSTGIYYFESQSCSYSAPNIPDIKSFDEKINNLSPLFVETYNQALSAESYNLSQIAGMGYRKALEFLIKDYCIFKNPDKKEEILKIFLGNCVDTYIDDSKIKSLAKVSVWLGNDETHYIRKFEDKDINDLKRFIDTTLYFILYNLNADEAQDIINSK